MKFGISGEFEYQAHSKTSLGIPRGLGSGGPAQRAPDTAET